MNISDATWMSSDKQI